MASVKFPGSLSGIGLELTAFKLKTALGLKIPFLDLVIMVFVERGKEETVTSGITDGEEAVTSGV